MTPKNGDKFESPMLKGNKGFTGAAQPKKPSGLVHSPAEKTNKSEGKGHKNSLK